MDSLISEISGIRFWFAVVFVNFVINILSHYLKSWLEKSYSNISTIYKRNLDNSKEIELNLFDTLKKSAELRQLHRDDAILDRIRSVWFISSGVGFYILALIIIIISPDDTIPYGVVLLFGGTLAIFLSIKYVTSSDKKWQRAIAATPR